MAQYTAIPPAIAQLTKTEAILILAASRLLTALQYREQNPGGAFGHYIECILEEMVNIN